MKALDNIEQQRAQLEPNFMLALHSVQGMELVCCEQVMHAVSTNLQCTRPSLGEVPTLAVDILHQVCDADIL